jgi:hypothetical protein
MEPGTRVVSHQYSMADWDPDESARIEGRDVYLWVVPARVDGVWDFHDRQGTPFAIELRQTFGKLAGEITRGRVREPLLSATVRGHDLRFTTAGSRVALLVPQRLDGVHRGGCAASVLPMPARTTRTMIAAMTIPHARPGR